MADMVIRNFSKGAMDNWPALKKWTYAFLERQYGENEIHIKLTSDGVFEGCDRAEHFSNFKTFRVPDFVKRQLPFPEMVVVRPATMNLNFSAFLDMIRRPPNFGNMSAYLEYSSIPDHMPELEKDISEFDFVKGILTRRHLNIWLSNGNTLGKLHFDPYENFLCQVTCSNLSSTKMKVTAQIEI
jgi:jumonji domain-containing protein 7